LIGPRHSANGLIEPKRACDFSTPEALILAADVEASRAFVGAWDGQPGDGGDCTHIDTSGMREVRLAAGRAYAGNVTMLHESLPVPQGVKRTLVRLNVPGWHAA
jgi:predicted 2-oxoglutarate/Fe(II)-dependent dioxygenase YbiX